MSKVIVITSGKGGVGKTTTAINLGAAMNYFGEKILIVDGNLTTPNIGLHLNSPEAPINLNDVLKGNADLEESIYEHDSGMRVIPSSLSVKELEELNLEKLKGLKDELANACDYVIIDSAAGLGDEAISAISIADEIILVTNPEMPAITDALKTIKVAEKMNKKVVGVIITKVRKDKIEMQPETVKEMLEVPILGMIPEDIYIKDSLNYKDAVIHVFPKSRASRAYKEIAANILNVPYDSNKDRERMIKRLLQRLGLSS